MPGEGQPATDGRRREVPQPSSAEPTHIRREVPQRWLWVGIFLVLGVAAVWVQNAVLPFRTPFWGLFDNQDDLDVYRHGSRAVLDGVRLYEGYILPRLDLRYTYTPISGVLFIPFALMSMEVARVVWSVGIFIALYFVITLSLKHLGYQINWYLRLIAVGLVSIATVIEPVRTTMWYGQINVFLMLVILADLLRPDGSRLRGVGAGIAAGIKLTPLIFGFYLLVVGKWRGALGVVGGFLATVAAGAILLPSDSVTYWSGTFLQSDRVGAVMQPGNQSLNGIIANLTQSQHPNRLVWVASAAAALVLGMSAARLAHRHGNELLALTMTGLTATTVSPMSWAHHWVWFIPLLVIVLDRCWQARNRLVRWGALASAAGLVILTFIWRRDVYTASGDWFPLLGMFFDENPPAIRWLTVGLYVWLFVIAAITTIIAFTVGRQRELSLSHKNVR